MNKSKPRKSKLSLKRKSGESTEFTNAAQTITSMFEKQQNKVKSSTFISKSSSHKTACSSADLSKDDDDVIIIEDVEEGKSPYFKHHSSESQQRAPSVRKDSKSEENFNIKKKDATKFDKKRKSSKSSKEDTEKDDIPPQNKKTKLSFASTSADKQENVQVNGSNGKVVKDRSLEEEMSLQQEHSIIGKVTKLTKETKLAHTIKHRNETNNAIKTESINTYSSVDSQTQSVAVNNEKEKNTILSSSTSKVLRDNDAPTRKEHSLEEEDKQQDVDIDEDDAEKPEENTFRVPYYLQNFETILNSVLKDQPNLELFNAEDMQVINSYQNLSEPARKLYIRLFSRKLNWIPLSKLNYPEIAKDLQPVLTELITSRLVDSDEHLTDLREVLNVLPAADIKAFAKPYHIPATVTQKPQLIQELMKKSQQSTLSTMFGSKGGGVANAMLKKAKKYVSHIYRLRSDTRAVFVRVMTLFSLLDTSGDDESGNGGQGQLFHLLMVNMGKLVYPSYTVHKVHRIFRDRDDLIRFEQALQLESDLLQCTERGKWEEAYHVYSNVVKQLEHFNGDPEIMKWNQDLPDFLRAFTATAVLYRLLNIGIEILQRRKDFKAAIALLRQLLAQDLYCCTYRGYWWERLALNLDAHMKQPLKSLEAVAEGLADKYVKVAHRYALYLRAEAICQRPKLKLKDRLSEFQHTPVKETPKVFLDGRVVHQDVTTTGTRFLLDNDDNDLGDMTVGGVEEFVLNHYNRNGYPSGIHAEGMIVGCLFALFFWDIIFMDIPDAFHSPFQGQPLDMYTESFYKNREDLIEERLEKINGSTTQELHQMAAETWSEHEGELCVGMNWEKMRNIEFVQGLITCMGGKVLSGIVGRMARCPRHTRSGFPDLTLWNVETGALKICEVKGPNDRLSNKQILWIDYLLSLGVDAEVCHVKAVAAKKLRV